MVEASAQAGVVVLPQAGQQGPVVPVVQPEVSAASSGGLADDQLMMLANLAALSGDVKVMEAVMQLAGSSQSKVASAAYAAVEQAYTARLQASIIEQLQATQPQQQSTTVAATDGANVVTAVQAPAGQGAFAGAKSATVVTPEGAAAQMTEGLAGVTPPPATSGITIPVEGDVNVSGNNIPVTIGGEKTSLAAALTHTTEVITDQQQHHNKHAKHGHQHAEAGTQAQPVTNQSSFVDRVAKPMVTTPYLA